MSELLLKVATKLFNKTEDEIKPLIFDEEGKELDTAFENLVNLDTGRIKRMKDETTKQFNEGHKKGKAETASEIETYLKNQFEVDIDGNYEKITETAKEKFASNKAEGKKITWEDIKKHQDFLNYEKSVVPRTKYEELTGEFDGYKVKVARDQKFSQVKNQAKKLLETFNPDFSMYQDAPQIKNNLIDLYMSEFDKLEDVEIDTDGNVMAMIKDGKRMEDDRLNVIQFKDYAKEKAGNYFKFLKQAPKGGAGTGQKPGGNGTPEIFAGMTKEDAYKKYTEAKNSGAGMEELRKMNAALQEMAAQQ